MGFISCHIMLPAINSLVGEHKHAHTSTSIVDKRKYKN